MSTVTDVITAVALKLGVPPVVAVAVAQLESGLNPNAIGDNGHSVGLFQLNDQGEGAGLSVAQREDPMTNATIAIRKIAEVAAANPTASWGQIAAMAQRPANPAAYAGKLDTQPSIDALNRQRWGTNGTGTDSNGSPTGASFTDAIGHAIADGALFLGRLVFDGIRQNVIGFAIGGFVLLWLFGSQ